MLAGVAGLEHLAPAVRATHEAWDGSGYPDGLHGDQIPLSARIVSVVDAYDAMTSERAYRQPLPRREALRRLRAGSGVQFDPHVVDAILRVL
jgi:HD-GYP domain-containing protein (c-di-GMP phosphodiesterase class II)